MTSSRTENIKYLLKRPKTPVIKHPYKSMFSDLAMVTYDAQKSCPRTMGYPDVKVDKKPFLKKNSRKVVKPLVEKTVPAVCKRETIAPQKYGYGVDNARKLTAASAKKTKVEKNFVRMNITDAIRKVPPLPQRRSQDTRNGHVIVRDDAGLEPKYVLKKGFGKTPAYIKRYRAEEAARCLADKERLRSTKPSHILPVDEHDEIFKGLKAKLSTMQEKFLLFPLIIETPGNLKTQTT